MPPPTFRPIVDCAAEIHDGDALLFHRAKSWKSWFIGVNSRSTVSHVGMALWIHGTLCVLEMDEEVGGRAIGLHKYLAWGRRVDVYRIEATTRQRNVAIKAMCRLLTQEYRLETVWRQALITLPVLRLWTHWQHPELIEQVADDSGNGDYGPKVCSEGYLWAWRQAGIDLLPNMADWAAPPAQVVQTSRCRYLFTPTLEAPDVAA